MESEELRMESGKWRVESEELRMESGVAVVASGFLNKSVVEQNKTRT
ncbi:MAG: hypothetical protein ACI4FO_04180 [Acutalibacteraceae bacterium]